MTPEQSLVGREVWYSGHVQGVGFRYSVRSIAQRFDVAGTVRNLPDGRVHLAVEGTPDQVDAFLAEIARRMSPFIRDLLVENRSAKGEFDGFEIRL